MLLVLSGNGGNDLAKAQNLISCQPGVVEAEVWEGKGGTILSRIVVDESSRLNAKDIQQLCLKKLGAVATPRFVMIEKIRRLAA